MKPTFQDTQRGFAQYLRDPHQPLPVDIAPVGAERYRALVLNNLVSFLDACFPVCRLLLGESDWRTLNRAFFRDWPLHTPWFREIPQEFVRYLAQLTPTSPWPEYVPELAHYEWVELAVDLMEAPAVCHDPHGDLRQGRVVLNPTLWLLHYQWPVHQISLEYQPSTPEPTQLAVYRDAEMQVRFTQLNTVTARLLSVLATVDGSGTQAVLQIANELAHPHPSQLLEFGWALLESLRHQGIVLGSAAHEAL